MRLVKNFFKQHQEFKEVQLLFEYDVTLCAIFLLISSKSSDLNLEMNFQLSKQEKVRQS